ncbi:hypothetical protein GLYMA_19G184450v4 [Glycine max]|nr:hypothetical protein GLYMA_19G184450v4 [Glycine max]KAH1078490.1 hypothetical protein GYH30_053480 [Glycine max]
MISALLCLAAIWNNRAWKLHIVIKIFNLYPSLNHSFFSDPLVGLYLRQLTTSWNIPLLT